VPPRRLLPVQAAGPFSSLLNLVSYEMTLLVEAVGDVLTPTVRGH
jgi:hypothetical protein